MSNSERLSFASVTDLAAWIAGAEVTSREVTEHFIARIEALNPRLNAFKRILSAEARAEADARDALQASGAQLGPLHGVPIAIKDENDVEGTPTTYGGAASTVIASRDSEVVRRLRQAGAVIIGKTLMPEFGIWPYTETEANGITRNPWDVTRSPAGSSGGTAAAVAAGMVPAGIGGDGGGSIRLPSAACGLFGLKPQRGRVSAAPNAALWRSLGTIGPLTRTVADAALIYDVIAGTTPTDAYHATPWDAPLLDALTTNPGSLRILVASDNPNGGPAADAETLAALEATAQTLAALGHIVSHGTLPKASTALPFLFQVAGGVLDEAKRVDHPERLEGRTKAMVRVATITKPWAAWAERAGAAASTTINTVFEEYDLVLTPTATTPAVRAGQLSGVGFVRASLKATPAASFTSIWNLCGNPAAALPSGRSADGLPLSVQIIGRAGGEATIMAVSAQLERVRPWAEFRPTL
ncbi:amidase [Lysinibacter cavernae]|uniref:Amidase n=1 Tax=Lysinibacter cavernae TaxID=1640652 RepID=A0A7X5R396_9MICO|nr:amidase [Lysinibacter cavernae]NIH54829.1 amidase [Lysinibacter cavernae]